MHKSVGLTLYNCAYKTCTKTFSVEGWGRIPAHAQSPAVLFRSCGLIFAAGVTETRDQVGKTIRMDRKRRAGS